MSVRSNSPATGLSPARRQPGFSFVELIIVLALLAIVAAAAIPALSPVSEKTLDIAASEVAAAIRFARSEALRTRQSYGVNVSTVSQRLRVYWLDESWIIPIPNYSIYHPVDKKLYDLNFDTNPVFSDVEIDSVAFIYSGSATVFPNLGFNPSGTPKYAASGSVFLLSSGSVTLSHKDKQRIVSVEPITGRVTIQ